MRIYQLNDTWTKIHNQACQVKSNKVKPKKPPKVESIPSKTLSSRHHSFMGAMMHSVMLQFDPCAHLHLVNQNPNDKRKGQAVVSLANILMFLGCIHVRSAHPLNLCFILIHRPQLYLVKPQFKTRTDLLQFNGLGTSLLLINMMPE